VKAAKLTVPLEDRISIKEKIAYSFGDSASNLYWKVFEFFLVIFYTDVFGLPAAAVGTMLLVTQLIDAAADPVMGSIADRTKSRWGHFRPYLIWGAVPLAVAGVLTFSTPHLGSGAKLLYAYITYSCLMLIYTVVNIPYSALMGVMTPNSLERTTISSIRFLGAFTAAVFVQYFTLPLVKFFGHGNDTRGWQLTMVLYGALAVILLFICFSITRERVAPPPQQNADIKRDVLSLFRSRPWIVLVGVLLLTLAAFAVKGSVGTYYFKYFVKRQDLLGPFLVSNGLAFVAAVSLTSYLTKWIGKKQLFMLALGVGGVIIGFFWFLKPTDIFWMFALQIASSFVIGFNSPLVYAMFADTADHAEWLTGRRNTGLVFASAVFATKVGAAVGLWLFAHVLAFFGYVANTEQTARSIHGIILSTSWIPCVLLILAASTMAFYPLSEPLMVKIEAELKERRGEIKA
jgi:GPH family glycoside/pentoside/hexuronide:cation symporter